MTQQNPAEPSPAEPSPAEPAALTAPATAVGSSSCNVSIVRRDKETGEERTFHIIGTAHVSRQSVEEVKQVISEIRPDTVCVELDEMRYEALTDESRWRKLDIFQVIKQKKMLFLMANLALQAFQRRMGEKLGVRPGSELLAAIDTAKEVGAEVVLADRDVQATLKRTWSNVSFWSKLKLTSLLVSVTLFENEDVDEEQIEALKDRQQFDDFLSEFVKVMPEVKEPLIDERDQYLMSSIEDAPGKTVVAVVGAAHVDGMVKHLGKKVDRQALTVIPPKSPWIKLLKWVIPLIIFGAFYWGYREHQGDNLRDMIYAWVIPNAVAAGLFTLLAGGKVLSILTGIVASPITSLNPTIGAGMVVGLVEAWLRKPTVADCEQLGKEISTLKGMYHNPFSRILLVAIAATLGSSIGAYVGAGWVLTLL